MTTEAQWRCGIIGMTEKFSGEYRGVRSWWRKCGTTWIAETEIRKDGYVGGGDAGQNRRDAGRRIWTFGKNQRILGYWCLCHSWTRIFTCQHGRYVQAGKAYMKNYYRHIGGISVASALVRPPGPVRGIVPAVWGPRGVGVFVCHKSLLRELPFGVPGLVPP